MQVSTMFLVFILCTANDVFKTFLHDYVHAKMKQNVHFSDFIPQI